MKTGIYWQDPKYPGRGMDFIFDPSLVLYLPLHKLDGASFMSKDTHGCLCTVTGAQWRPDGRYFDGSDDNIDCGDSGLPFGASPRTLEFWMKRAYSGDAVRYEYQVNYGTGIGGQTFGTVMPINSTDLFFFGWGADVDSGFDIADTDWHHVVITFDGTTLKTHMDGVAGNTDTPSLNTVSSGHVIIGRRIDLSEGLAFNGLIGEVRVYNRVLTPLEIQRNYLATKWRYR